MGARVSLLPVTRAKEKSHETSDGDKYQKFVFTKIGDSWYLTGEDGGLLKDLDPAKYAWDKNIPGVAEDMKAFMAMFDGTSDAVEAALKKYAPGVEDTKNMDITALEDPRVVKMEKKGDRVIYTMKTKAGMITNTYLLTWKAGKITSIEEK